MSSDLGRPLRICYFGTYRANYMRSQIIIEALRQAGVEVIECHETLWRGIEDRVKAASGGWKNPSFWLRVASAYFRLSIRYARIGAYDVMVVGYPGQIDVFLARFLTWMRHKPLAWDILMSIYLVATDRGLNKKSPATINILHTIEKMACDLPDLLILDTHAYVKWFTEHYKISKDRFRLVPLGADNRIFHPQPIQQRHPDAKFRVTYYGTFIPNHGVPFIIEAARLLAEHDDICIELIGEGPDLEISQALANHYQLNNVTFIRWMDKEDLVQHIASTDVCLGAFGRVTQSYITIHNKIYEGLAMAKPVLTADNPALHEQFIHGEHLYMCGRDDPRQLSDAILHLKQDPELRLRLCQNGFMIYQKHYTLQHLGQIYKQHLEQLIENRP